MKSPPTYLSLAVVLLFLIGLSIGCYGTTPLSRGIAGWHAKSFPEETTGQKWTKELVFLPIFFLAFPVTALVDYFILNPIEFFSGSPPIPLGDSKGQSQ